MSEAADTATKWLIERIHEYGFEGVATIAAVGAVAAFGLGWAANWLLSQRKIQKEIEKYEIKNRQAYLNISKELESTEEALGLNGSLLNSSLDELLQALQHSRKRALRSARQEVCSFYASDYVAALHKAAQRADVVLKPRDQKRFVMRCGLPHLRVMRRFLEMVNDPRLLKKLGDAAPYKLSPSMTAVLADTLFHMLPFWALRTRFLVWKQFLAMRRHLRKY